MKLITLLGFVSFLLIYFVFNYDTKQLNETKQIVQEVKQIQKNILTESQLIVELQRLINSIRLSHMGNYSNLNKNNFDVNLGLYDWNIGGHAENQFFVELKNIDKTSCNRLMNVFSDAVTVKINSIVANDCDDLNDIMFIFE